MTDTVQIKTQTPLPRVAASTGTQPTIELLVNRTKDLQRECHDLRVMLNAVIERLERTNG